MREENGCLGVLSLILLVVGFWFFDWITRNMWFVYSVLGIILLIIVVKVKSNIEKKREEEKIKKEKDILFNKFSKTLDNFTNTVKEFKNFQLEISNIFLLSDLIPEIKDKLVDFTNFSEDIVIQNYLNFKSNLEKELSNIPNEDINIKLFNFPLQIAMDIYGRVDYRIHLNNPEKFSTFIEDYLVKKYFYNVENQNPDMIKSVNIAKVLCRVLPYTRDDLYYIWSRNCEIVEKIKIRQAIEAPDFEKKVAKELERLKYMTSDEVFEEIRIYLDLVKNEFKPRNIVKEYAYSKFKEQY